MEGGSPGGGRDRRGIAHGHSVESSGLSFVEHGTEAISQMSTIQIQRF
jgi:hypothetical protein